MRKLSLILLPVLVLSLVSLRFTSPSPHGKDFRYSCELCHNPNGWEVDTRDIRFDHAVTGFALDGVHRETDCRMCHSSLVFGDAGTECADCHTDVHENTLGASCERCHTPRSWIVSDITLMHQQGRLPLVGPHSTADCYDCHKSASLLRFEPIGVTCYECHVNDYLSASEPNHVQGNFSTDCEECHLTNAFSWSGAGFNHTFFPLTKGHAVSDCFACHTQGSPYSSISPDCWSCHAGDYNAATNPNHATSGFPVQCNDCHTTDPGWKPASFALHDNLFFPIYSGEHEGEWESCGDCHENPSDYSSFTCISCHEHNKQDMDDEHDDVGGYIYESRACLECHPTGSGELGFNHNTSAFPLTGAHITTACVDCHANGYDNTPTGCNDCHNPDYQQAQNPSHLVLALSVNCLDCHTTLPGWSPASFAQHNQLYPLLGAHALLSNDCFGCHKGDYVNTPNTCYGCHEGDYTQATNPNHQSAQFPTDCEVCHTQNAWQPSTFNHDGQYFPIYSGKHDGEWDECSDCHTSPGNYAIFSCIDCHEHNQQDMDDEHQGVSGYVYNSIACLNCHPDGSEQSGTRRFTPKRVR